MKTLSTFHTDRNALRTLLLAMIAVAAIVMAVTLVLRSGGDSTPVAADSASAPSSAPAPAAYIKFDGVDGEAKDRDRGGWSDILSFSHGISRPMTAGATGATRQRGDVTLGDLVVVKELDKSSPKLMEALTTGNIFPSITLDVARSSSDGGRTTYLQWELTNVMVTNYRVGGATSGDDRPTETISLNYEEIKVTYTEQDAATGATKGNVEYNWKVEEGTK